MTSEGIARILEALAALIWPVLAIAVVVVLLPVLREIVRRRQFVIKIGSFELSAQEATNQLLTQIEDLQKRVIVLEQAAAPPPATGTARDPDAAPRPSDTRPAARRILWVDDVPRNNATLITAFESDGVAVETVQSGAEAMAQLSASPARFAAVITDQGRVEDGRFVPDAGDRLVRDIRGAGLPVPIALYTSARGVRSGGEALSAGAEVVTASPTELRAFVARHTGMAGAD